jgi:hypothetical protein
MLYGRRTGNAPLVRSAVRSVLMWPFECGKSEDGWGNGGIGSEGDTKSLIQYSGNPTFHYSRYIYGPTF